MRYQAHRGLALILVLWLVAALSIMSLSATHLFQSHVRGIGAEFSRVRAESVLDAAINLVMQKAVTNSDFVKEYRRVKFNSDLFQVEVEVVPGAGLVDLNVASEDLIVKLFQSVAELSQDQALIISHRIRDWIDPDDEPYGVGGAESNQYRAAGWPVLPRNAALEDPAVLRSVLGVTSDIYAKVSPFISLNGQQKVNAYAAPPELLDLLTGQPGLGQRFYEASAEQKAAVAMTVVDRTNVSFDPIAPSGEIRLRARLIGSDGEGWQRELWFRRAAAPYSGTPWTTMLVSPLQRVASSAE